MQNIIENNFINFSDENIEVHFSLGDVDYNKSTESGRENINNLKDIFSLDSIKYISQVHSDKIISLKDKSEDTSKVEADAIVTDITDVGIGVFYADCVPVILYDKESGTTAAVHSGWKGTYMEIAKKTVLRMVTDYKVNVENLKVIIGPHIRECCYEISEDLKSQFNGKESFKGVSLFKDRNLSLEKAITKSLSDAGIKEENIVSLDYCTFCEKDIKLHSYRRDGSLAGRCYAFIVKKSWGD